MNSAILAAGDGTRLQSIYPFKPQIKVCGKTLLEYSLKRLTPISESITIIFNEKELKMDVSPIKSIENVEVNHFFKSTPSSLHSLYEIAQRVPPNNKHLLVTMIDSIIREEDFLGFVNFCSNLKTNESCLMTTSYIEDEKPLTLSVDENNTITAFQIPLNETKLITSGIYFFSPEAIPVINECIQNGVFKMRNFLNKLQQSGHIIKSFEVEKTLDIDRPEDIESAERFLSNDN